MEKLIDLPEKVRASMNMACGVSMMTYVNLMHLEEHGAFIPIIVTFGECKYKLKSFSNNNNAIYEQIDVKVQ